MLQCFVSRIARVNVSIVSRFISISISSICFFALSVVCSTDALAVQGGIVANVSDSPATVRVFFFTVPYESVVGTAPGEKFTATRIGPRTYLTCAHCIFDFKVGDHVNIGQYSDSTSANPALNARSWARVVRSSYHPKYISSQFAAAYDVGVFEVDTDLPNIAVAQLPGANDTALFHGILYVAGYGYNEIESPNAYTSPVRATLAASDSDTDHLFPDYTDSYILVSSRTHNEVGQGIIRGGDSGSGIFNAEFDPVTGLPRAGRVIVGVVNKGPHLESGANSKSNFNGLGARLDNHDVMTWLQSLFPPSLF